MPEGWDLASATCDDGSDPTAIVLDPGENVVCSFINAQRGRILVDKVTDPPGSAQEFEFNPSWSDDNFTLTGGADPADSGLLLPGRTYSVVELDTPGWDLTEATCTGGRNPVSVTLSAGETVTCTFTNTQRGAIVVEKQTDPDGAAGDFTFTGDAAGTIADGGQIVVPDLVPGSYTSTEEDPAPGFDLTSIVCDDDDSPGMWAAARRRSWWRPGRR